MHLAIALFLASKQHHDVITLSSLLIAHRSLLLASFVSIEGIMDGAQHTRADSSGRGMAILINFSTSMASNSWHSMVAFHVKQVLFLLSYTLVHESDLFFIIKELSAAKDS
jgi:hypothetical protein